MSYDIYADQILDHYKNPRNYGHIDSPDFKAKDSNPLCGDIIEISVKLDGDKRVQDVKFEGEGCAISQASASMLTEMIMGKHVDELKSLSSSFVLDAIGIGKISPARLKCALLPLGVLKLGVKEYLGEK